MLQPRKNLSIFAFCIFTIIQVSVAKRCPQGWYGYMNNCYFFSASTADWNTAKDICATRGSVLATLNTPDEVLYITNQSLSIGGGKSFYVGATDKGKEGKWRNVDNSKFPSGKKIWAPGQPDNYKKAEHCATFSSYNKYKLNDSPCNGAHNYICERGIDYKDPCDSENGWHLIKGRCYRFFKEPSSWPEARKSCTDYGADLLSINSNEELSLVGESVSCDNVSPIWLGYSDTNAAQTLQWVDKSKPAASLMKWDTVNGEPSTSKYTKGNNCAASITLNKNLWELTNCLGNDMAYICEKDQGQCPTGWTIRGGVCYKSFYDAKSWPQAQKLCQGYGGNIASTTDLQNAAVAKTSFTYWVALSDRAQDGKFVDLDGNAVPSSVLKTQTANKLTECGIVKSGKISVANCYSKNYYTCTASKAKVVATPPSAPSDGLMCYGGWSKYKGSCYKRFTRGKKYSAANADCKSNQATLLIINDQAEMDFLITDPLLLNGLSWLGLDDLKSAGTFKWTDGSPSTYTYWAPNEPNNHRNKEHCAEVQSKSYRTPGTWNDVDCNGARPYICESAAVTGDQTTTPRPTRPWSRECGQGWTVDHLSGKCYYFSLERKNWLDSQKACQKMKATLMSVESKYEQSFMQGILRGDRSGALAYWVGGNDRDIEQGWRWSDGKPFKYFNWNDGEPNSAGNEDCIEVVRLTGRWNDNNCNRNRNYICERGSSISTKPSGYGTTPLPTISENCTSMELISGDHWVPDSAITASSVRDKDSGPENSRIDWTATDKKVTINTDKRYRYQSVANLNLKGATFVKFTVQACNDAHISLQPMVDNITRDAFEIVIGGWKNTQCVIRSEHQRNTQVQVRKSKLLDCNKANPFWISWATGKIQVGTGYSISGTSMFMELAVVKDSLAISGMAVTTGWGSNGVWVITNPHGTRKGAWSPKYSVRKVPIGTEQYIYNQWIQVDFAKPTLVQSVTTKGSASMNAYVVEYYLEYSYDSPNTFQPYYAPGSKTMRYFAGNKDQNTAVTNKLEAPIEAQYIRIRLRKFINYPSLRWALNGCPPPKYCDPEKLVTGESRLDDWAIRMSSLKDSTVYDARLVAVPGKPDPKGWLASAPNLQPNTLSEEWVQIYLRKNMLIHGVVTKGHATRPYWVKSFQVQTRSVSSGFKFINYQEPYGTIKTFTANRDQNTAVTNMFKNVVVGSYIRILPKEYNTMIGMRLDVLGCLEGCSVAPMLNGRNAISDSRLSASSSSSAQMGPTRVRLDTTGFGGAWVPQAGQKKPFFQVDFGITERIAAVTTQGRSDQDQWVKSYTITYSLDGKTFYNYRFGYRFQANSDRNTKRKNFLPTTLTARAIRINPISFNGRPAMRLELYGCSGSNPKSLGCYTEGSHIDSFDGPTSYFSYNSPARCSASCFKEGFMYAGLNRGTCKCGSSLPYGGISTRCNYKCRGDQKFICGGYSSGLMSVYETGIGPDDERCPVGYDTFNSKCFKVSKVLQNWQAARSACQSDGGDLATINSVAEQTYLKNQLAKLSKGAWIGLNDLRDQMSFEWADGTPVYATFWMHTEPNNYLGKNEDCVEAISYIEMAKGYNNVKVKAENGLWNDFKCEQDRYSICQKKKQRMDTPVTTPAPPKGCPFGWKAFKSSCYLMMEHRSTWNLASNTCQKEGGTLVRINDEFEQYFLTGEIFKRTGYTYAKANTLYWTDLRQNPTTKEYVWSNKWDMIPYTHWAQGQPQPITATVKPISSSSFWPLGGANFAKLLAQHQRNNLVNCVAMNGQNEKNTGYWRGQNCLTGVAFPLCERPRTGYKQPPLPTFAPEDIACPAGWVGVGPNCYQVNKPTDPLQRKMWTNAEQHCVAQGAHLAYINNGTENDQLWRNYILQPTSDSNNYWIGLNDRAKNKGYRWVSGDGFSYSNWKQGEPNDWKGLEPCVMLDGADGMWNDARCHVPSNWICSISRSDVKKIRTVVTTPEPTPGPTGSCANGDEWKSFQGNCYYLNKDLLTFREAEAYCNSKGAYLVSIQSSLENSFVKAISKGLVKNLNSISASRAAIGNAFTQVWTGLNEMDRSKGHRWSDGSAYKYSNWAMNEPNDYNGGEYCVGFYVVTGEWNDGHCSIRVPSVCKSNPKHPVGVPLTSTLPPHIDGFCPSGYVAFENNCYKIVVDTPMNWTSAEFTCEAEGGHLASVMNSREQTFLTSQLNTAVQARVALWLGLKHGSALKNSFFKHSTSYVWVSNHDVSYTYWNHGEPNGLNKEACTEMLFNPAGRWNDVSCDSARGFICSKPKDGSVTTPPPHDNSRCPQGYYHWQDACYKYVDSKGTWNYLDGNTCGTDGANLLSIQDPYEYAFVRSWMWSQGISEDVWIGLMSQANSNTFTWSNAWPVVVTYWDKNEPANFQQEEGCVLMNSGNGEDDGRWKHTSCKEMHAAICKKPLGGPPIKPPPNNVCKSAAGERWIANADGYCYLFNPDPRYTYDEAEAACRTAGADLASVHSDSDTSFITTHMEHLDVLGGNGGTKNVWIGLRKLNSGSFEWSDNSAVYYANWAANEPNGVEGNEKCTEVWSPNSDWNDVNCQSKRGFICKIAQGSLPATFPTPINAVPTTLPTTTKRNSPCQLDGWSFYKGKCYLMVSQTNEFLRWNEANDYCKAPGREGHLATIQSEAENQWIVEKLLPSRMQGDAWIGLGELQRDNQLKWVDNSRFSYINWDSDQPSTNKGSMECVAMATAGGSGASGKWATEYCFSKKGFICEIDANKTISAVVGTSITDGSLCHFPFKYRGQDYNTCTTYGSSFLWCATSDHYERDGKFAICDPFRCPPGWRRHERLCYFFSQATDKRSWLDAEQSCADMKSDLAFIGDATVESFITDNINEYFWTGLNDKRSEGRLNWDHRPTMIMVRGFTNWGLGEPRSIFGTEDCTLVVNGPYADNRPGEWVMANCDLARRYICMKSADYTLKPSTAAPIPTTTPAVTYTSVIDDRNNKPTTNSTSKGFNVGGPEAVVQTTASSDLLRLRTGEIIAITVACLAFGLAAVFMFLYIRRSRQTAQEEALKSIGFENASYSRSQDSVHVGLENPNFSAD